VAFAVNNPDAPFAQTLGTVEKECQGLPRLGNGVSVQIEFCLDCDLASTELPDHALLQSRPDKQKIVAGLDVRLVLVGKQIRQNHLLVATSL